jgi:hypothetical protein
MLDTNFNNLPVNENSLAIVYSANDIDYDLVSLFNDFSQSLLMLVFETYLGDDITSSEDKLNHFNWCWLQNIENFKKEGIVFSENTTLHDYFLEFLINFFYLIDKENDLEEIIMAIRLIWTSIFSYDKVKTNLEVDNFLKIYKLMEESLKSV